ncbi:ABC transporter permease [Acidisphaera sp. S103]|uniref:ABC transporter permease n=1 Tax=Acidisphaera sp. S103 TaxID=1747223 RepID=UPI00131E970C|nr:ABC transporter permease [Acidisphaera sp. S103]
MTTIAPTSELILRADTTFAVRNRWAMADIVGGARLWRLALTLGWLDIRLRYRGSMLGPFWLTISTGVMVGALGVLYSTLFKINVREYLPFLALSQVLWGFLAALVSEACAAFTEAEGVIRSVRMPFFVFSIRTLIRNAIALAHNIVVIVVVFAIFSIWPHWEGLMAIPGLLVWCVDALALTLLLGGFCARFRDIQPIVNSVMQIAFFMTPVIWKPDQLGPKRIEELALNPFFDLLEIVRGPILNSPIATTTWVGAIGFSLVLCVISWAFFVRARGRVTFWV